MSSVRRIDVFCRVVDNFGDAGVALRLARQLHHEHGIDVTLFIDDAQSLARIAPGLDAAHADQWRDGVRVRHCDAANLSDEMPQAIVDAFGDSVPEAFLDRFERARRPPLWIVLEYLSAERWVDDRHGLPSPPAKRALKRWFFFPGFTAATGGLLRERGAVATDHREAGDTQARRQPWLDIGAAPPSGDAIVVSLFCYPNRALLPLLRAWQQDPQPIACIVPEGVGVDALDASFGGGRARVGEVRRAGALTVAAAPFVDQAAFDRRLRASDVAFVRGEDSFVRAQWAAVPFVWHAYPQPDGAHAAKVDAFVARYVEPAQDDVATAIRALWHAFNDEDADAIAPAWRAYRGRLASLREHAARWAHALATQQDLATRLVRFIEERL
jgi:uncharacterized repeat protein (TIGR03837 family)